MPLDLIFDRTQADADYIESLNARGVENWTPEEFEFWLHGTVRGAYDASVMNRVGEVVNYLSDMLRQHGYAVAAAPKTDWSDGAVAPPDTPPGDVFPRYLANIEELRSVLPVISGTPEAPPSSRGIDDLSIEEANNIERILFNLEKVVTYITAYPHQRVAATFYAGGSVTLQKFSRGR